MYAIVEIGGKQYKVSSGNRIKTERFPQKEGAKVNIDKVLLVSSDSDKGILIGQPYVKGVSVSATLVRNLRSKKVITFKYKRRKSTHKTVGHRQNLSELLVENISVGK
jgi:large subunit ribosomal protein L21